MRAIDDGDQRLEELWDAHARRLHAYARRHADAADAEDLVAEAFVVALRRIDDVPDESGEAFAWLVVTVRKLAANQRRRAATRDQHWARRPFATCGTRSWGPRPRTGWLIVTNASTRWPG